MVRILILVRLLFYICISNAQMLMDQSDTWLPVDHLCHSVEFGDIDNDLDNDMICKYYGLIKILLNTGNSYLESDFIETGSALGMCKLFDIDADSDLDLLIVNSGQDFLLINDGTGTFTDVTESHLPQIFARGKDIDIGDLDSDGDLDFVSASESTIESEDGLLFLNIDGEGIFIDFTIGLGLTLPHVGIFQKTSMHDVDSDGDLDLWFGFDPYQGEEPQSVMIRNSGVGLDLSSVYYDNYMYSASRDVDSDGDIDIISLSNDSQSIEAKLLINNGLGVYEDETSLRMPDDAFSKIIFADLDNELGVDAIVKYNDTINVIINQGNGYFIDSTNYWLGTSLFSGIGNDYYLTDIDLDGDSDFYITGSTSMHDKIFINNYNNGGAISKSNSSINTYTPALADGLDSIKVYINIKDHALNPLSSRKIKVYSNAPDIFVSQPLSSDGSKVTTDENGLAVGYVKSTEPGAYLILAIAENEFLLETTALSHFVENVVIGDVNADGLVNILDVVRIVNIILGIGYTPSMYERTSSDLNIDSDINILDIIELINLILTV